MKEAETARHPAGRVRAVPLLPSGTSSAALLLAATLVAASVVACGGSLSSSPAEYGAPSSEQAVRGFLGALSREDVPSMARHFGTREGPAEKRWGTEEVEQRMLVLSGLLEHETHDVRRARLTEPREDRNRYLVTLQGTRYGAVTLPVVTVRSGSGRWFVERIDTTPLRP